MQASSIVQTVANYCNITLIFDNVLTVIALVVCPYNKKRGHSTITSSTLLVVCNTEQK